MTIRTKFDAIPIAYAAVLTVYPVRTFVENHSDWWWLSIIELAIISAAILAYRFRRKWQIKFDSREDGVVVAGSKEGRYDPDYIAYDDIATVARDHGQIVIGTRDGTSVRLVGIKRHADAILTELRARTAQKEA